MGQGSQRGMKITLPLIPSHQGRGTMTTGPSPLGGRGAGWGWGGYFRGNDKITNPINLTQVPKKVLFNLPHVKIPDISLELWRGPC
jgi:hypothetical protein